MKSNFIFGFIPVLLISFKLHSQSNNTVLQTNAPSPSFQNVLIGVGSGINLTTPTSGTLNNANVFIGYNSGLSSNATIVSPTNDTARNTFIGAYSGYYNTTGSDNVFIGYKAGFLNTVGIGNVSIKSVKTNPSPQNSMSGSLNTMVGNETGESISSGGYNSIFGGTAGRDLTTGSGNTLIGYNAGTNLKDGYRNICLGYGANYASNSGINNIYIGSYASGASQGEQNTIIGFKSGENLLTGSFNTFLGYVQVPSTVSTNTNLTVGNNTNNTIILADGSFNQRFFIHSNGFSGIGLGNNIIPKNTLEVKALSGSPTQGAGFPASGLRLTNIPNSNFNTVAPSSNRRVLTTNQNGDVILVDDIGGGINQNCSTANYVPLNGATANQLICSQIYDNSTSSGIGTSVGIGYSSAAAAIAAFPYTVNYSISNSTFGVVPSTGNARLRVNGVTWSDGFYSPSDRKFKKDIMPIEDALKTIELIDGKTYLWDREANKDRNFDGFGHSGFIAQDLEQVLPHLVATSQNGDKAVNYIELMPYLVEAIKEQQKQIKEQQSQIDDLKNQITENFKLQNQDLIELNNTKIISVSPNPSNDVITISLNIDKSVQVASLQVHDLNGKLLNNLSINDRSNNINKTLQKDNFGTGIYIVSLIINGKSIDAKKIIFN